MATQTGELQIDAVEGTQIRGWFRSVNDKNVHQPSHAFAIRVIFEAFAQLGVRLEEPAIAAQVQACTFTTPNKPATNFTITLTSDALIKDVGERLHGYWETYYLG